MIRKLLTATLTASVVFAVVYVFTGTSSAQSDVVILSGTIKKAKLKSKNRYLLQGGVFITKKMVIQAGTQIFGTQGSFLVIDRGAKIKATGTAEDPIVFTSDQPAGERRRGDWGGIIFNGRAPINVPGGEAEGEGDTGLYGGGANPDPADSSGNMTYMRVEYGGFAISPDNELNCIAFQGVGNGTDIDFVTAAWGGDDGFEFFGGTANAKHLVAVGASDDSVDWTEGWTGRIQFLVVQQRNDEADNGFECDNSAENHNLTPRSAPKIMNATLVGGGPDGTGSTRGILLRVGTHGEFRNFIVTGFKNVGLEIRDDATFAGFQSNTLSLRSFIFFNNGLRVNNNPQLALGRTSEAVGASGVKIQQNVDPLLANPFDTAAPDFRPQAGSPALVAANAEPAFPGDSFFTTANYLGAFDQNTDWTAGWVNWVFGN